MLCILRSITPSVPQPVLEAQNKCIINCHFFFSADQSSRTVGQSVGDGPPAFLPLASTAAGGVLLPRVSLTPRSSNSNGGLRDIFAENSTVGSEFPCPLAVCCITPGPLGITTPLKEAVVEDSSMSLLACRTCLRTDESFVLFTGRGRHRGLRGNALWAISSTGEKAWETARRGCIHELFPSGYHRMTTYSATRCCQRSIPLHCCKDRVLHQRFRADADLGGPRPGRLLVHRPGHRQIRVGRLQVGR